MDTMTFRYADAEDCGKILSFIRELASYENLTDQVTATEDLLREWLFEKKTGEVLFVCVNDIEVGFALYFRNYSTFNGRGGIYLEDLYITEQYRGRGYGKAVLKKLAEKALQEHCGRLEWVCLDWNQPAIDFFFRSAQNR